MNWDFRDTLEAWVELIFGFCKLAVGLLILTVIGKIGLVVLMAPWK